MKVCANAFSHKRRSLALTAFVVIAAILDALACSFPTLKIGPPSPFSEVKKYLDNSRIKKLLISLFGDSLFRNEPGIIRTRYPRVFCILLRAGKGHLIQEFCRHDQFQDVRLPFSDLNCARDFPTDRADPGFWMKFYKEQWVFFAAEFRGGDVRLENERRLPFFPQGRLANEGSTTMTKTVIHKGYNFLRQPTSSNQGSSSHSRNTFVLKTYRTLDAYRSEVEAFRFYGSFEQNQTYNVLLEFTGSVILEDYFQQKKPRTKEEDIKYIIKFWRRLFDLAEAISILEATISDCARPRSQPPPYQIDVVTPESPRRDDALDQLNLELGLVVRDYWLLAL
ncbi:hypothetical protein DL95DRAFT_488483 [Leptodontidium sp. 2 PMI_412]|nr:hypothetical protein DL95DRAFT_488483 [Leptodontidium sp. 2 PMI_412]